MEKSSGSSSISTRWQRFRERHLRKEPLCRSCLKQGRVTAATEVDHIVSITDGGATLDHDNLQSLCCAHHLSKSYAEQKGKDWRKHELRGCDEHGNPRDPDHAWYGDDAA